MAREAVLARTMVELADTLVDEFDIVDLLTTLSDRCVEVLDIAAAGIMLVDTDGQLRAMTSSSEAMRVVELFELQSQEGPCLDSFHSGRAVAVKAGFIAADAIPMRLRKQVIGALNLFRSEPGSLSDDDVAAAQALADVATIAILQHRLVVETQTVNEQLSLALSSRIVIEQAKGMIAQRQRVAVEQAFQRLRTHARNHNLRLADLAGDIVAGVVDPGSFDHLPA